ncbi:predicted protein [Naegleria gruberi]|uniref:Predicted protein n=1 Tax=Naegleria gruberi TaxID=5762 RepID=D2V0C3_NAEGR|nr:uncharacterized protein NAEGRDRAFT_62242 [Naegleria gruberi]EFC49692.1 predicted protein [Naegleria gruberi]|eukprot:XP_002682436.1 predicted protein [Naegleria gruberi strain NEG-M]
MKRQIIVDRQQQQQIHHEKIKAVTDLENSVPPSTPSIKKNILSSSSGPIKIKETQDKSFSSQKTTTGGQKRKALGDITNQEKSTITTQTNQQPTKKKKSELTTKNLTNQKPQLKIPTIEECEAIELCPQADSIADFLEYPTPIFMEFNPETGKAEDVFVTLSDEKMKQVTKPPTSEDSSLPFQVDVDSSGLPLPSPMPSAITPISFDDIFDAL